MNDELHRFFAQRDAVLVSMHEKEHIIAPLLTSQLGLQIRALTSIDTDQFGSFTGEVARSDTQYQTAVAKARAGMAQGYTVGIASEGSFAPHPEVPWLTVNHELVVLVDTVHDVVFEGWATSTAVTAMRQQVHNLAEVETFVRRVGFPDQGVIVRYHCATGVQWYKDVRTLIDIAQMVERGLGHSDCKVWLEADLRAHRNPKRREVIGQATTNLVQNLRRKCEACGLPGMRQVAVIDGLPCAWCGTPTQQIKAVIYACVGCAYRTTAPYGDGTASPEFCGVCNP